MKFLKIRRKDTRTKLEKECDDYIDLMWEYRDNPEEYAIMAETASMMTEAIASSKRDWLDILSVVVPLLGTIAVCISNLRMTSKVVRFEETDVITTKAPQFKLSWR